MPLLELCPLTPTSFADFLSTFIMHYERILIVVDFNIHIYYGEMPLVKDSLNIECFNFTQFMSGPMHQHGHTVRLMDYGLSVLVCYICILPVLDHSLILFNILIPNLLVFG